MSKEKFVVWSNLDLDLDDWRADLEDEYPGLNDDELIEKMTEINDSYIDDERANLDIVTGTEIIAIADIGRWDGRYMGYSEIKSGKISDCLYSPHDYSEWYVDADKEFRCTDVHHDGRNHMFSVGAALAKTDVTQEDVVKQLVTVKDKQNFGFLGFTDGENRYTYPSFDLGKVRSLYAVLQTLADFVVVDCTSNLKNPLSRVAVMEAETVIRLATPDLKSMS